MPTQTMSAAGATRRAPTSSYHPGTGRPREDEMRRLDRQADLTFEAELDLMLQAGLRTDGTLLDLGSGNGAITSRLRQALPEASVFAADVDPDLLSLVPAPALLIEDGRIPVSDESVDDVLVRFVAQHLTPAARLDLWTEALRVLRPGGRVHVIDVDDTDSGVISPLQPGLGPIFAKLHHAQAADGGDRMVIGKVPAELTQVGFDPVQRVRDAVSSTDRPLIDFAVHVGPERHVPHVSTGVLTLADLAAITRGWQAILADPESHVSVYVHLVRAVKPRPAPTGSDPTIEGDAP